MWPVRLTHLGQKLHRAVGKGKKTTGEDLRHVNITLVLHIIWKISQRYQGYLHIDVHWCIMVSIVVNIQQS